MTVEAVVYTETGTRTYDDLRAAREATGTTWVHASDATTDEMERVADAFGIHLLAVEDVRNEVRPKTEEFDDHTFVLLKTATLRRGETTFREEIAVRSVGFFVGDDWLVTMSPEPVGAVERVWDMVVREEGRILRNGPDFATYRVADGIVDAYFDVLDQIEDQIEQVEEDVTTATDIETLETINNVRRELLSFRKLLWPSREAIGYLARGDPEQIQESTEKYYRDVYDHLVQLVDLTETYRDLASGARDIYLNSLSLSTNEVMKKLTVVATIVLPLTFVVGVYGMNFADSPYNMPELGWTYGYPAVMLGMLAVTVILVAYFRKSGYV
ncbi:magnesium/cobalt transporter CorA [Halorussus gelatinilyticus]|uniref:Magnesium transport protein CorA n=1 Tax=Halorussus gelatinilyticus TaxID=2937524 RepID=A0A8U0IFL8_9EURY|nr:magnesium/cobalt transporter CorA [Halorussus gelatinilyticus]UPV99876.1 magnesium/cobalt transporter CorA [Halorussus gelatinilyticus]